MRRSTSRRDEVGAAHTRQAKGLVRGVQAVGPARRRLDGGGQRTNRRTAHRPCPRPAVPRQPRRPRSPGATARRWDYSASRRNPMPGDADCARRNAAGERADINRRSASSRAERVFGERRCQLLHRPFDAADQPQDQFARARPHHDAIRCRLMKGRQRIRAAAYTGDPDSGSHLRFAPGRAPRDRVPADWRWSKNRSVDPAGSRCRRARNAG